MGSTAFGKYSLSSQVSGLVFVNVVGQTHETVLKMYAFHLNVRGKLKINVSEIPDRLYVRICKGLRDIVCFGLGNGENDNINIFFIDIGTELFDRTDGDTADCLPHQLGIDVKSTNKIEPALFEFEISK